MEFPGRLPPWSVCFDRQVGSSATKAAKDAALMANEDLQIRPKIAL